MIQDRMCKTCKYWEDTNDHDSRGTCRLGPPQVTVVHKDNREKIMTYFPRTKRNDWCSEYEG